MVASKRRQHFKQDNIYILFDTGYLSCLHAAQLELIVLKYSCAGLVDITRVAENVDPLISCNSSLKHHLI